MELPPKLPQVHPSDRAESSSLMIPAYLIARLRSTGDPLHLLAADALIASSSEAEQLRQRVQQLEAIAKLNAETIRNMKRAAIEAMAAAYRRAPPQR
jgi:hypothetical protein